MGVEDAIGSETELRRYALTVEDFLHLDRAGAFAEVGHVELIDGEIYQLSPIHRRHARALLDIAYALRRAVDDAELELVVYSPVSLQIDDHNLPQPDLLVASAETGDGFVDPAAVVLAVEVSSSTLRHDLVRKAELYARRAIPEYWVVDLTNRELHQLTDPAAGGYLTRHVVPFGARVVSKKVPEIALDTSAFG